MLKHSVPHFPPNSGGIKIVLSCGTQRHALSRYQCEKIKIFYSSFSQVAIEPRTVVITVAIAE